MFPHVITAVIKVTKLEMTFDSSPLETLDMTNSDGKYRTLRLNPVKQTTKVKITMTESQDPGQTDIGLSGVKIYRRKLDGK